MTESELESYEKTVKDAVNNQVFKMAEKIKDLEAKLREADNHTTLRNDFIKELKEIIVDAIKGGRCNY